MKTRIIVKCAVLAVAMAASLSTTNSYADVQSTTIYHAIRGMSLADSLAQVAQRSGITFKIDTDLGKDKVSQLIDAENWNTAVRSLLVNFNFTIIQDSDTIKTVIISGRNHYAADTITANDIIASADDENIFEPILD
jgi:type II secretory pathway component GspD/PulD (secretin)